MFLYIGIRYTVHLYSNNTRPTFIHIYSYIYVQYIHTQSFHVAILHTHTYTYIQISFAVGHRPVRISRNMFLLSGTKYWNENKRLNAPMNFISTPLLTFYSNIIVKKRIGGIHDYILNIYAYILGLCYFEHDI